MTNLSDVKILGIHPFAGDDATDLIDQAAAITILLRHGFEQSAEAGPTPRTSAGEQFDVGIATMSPSIVVEALAGVGTLLAMAQQLAERAAR